jgi:hypothetical protein
MAEWQYQKLIKSGLSKLAEQQEEYERRRSGKKAAPKADDMSRRITEGSNVGVSRTAEVKAPGKPKRSVTDKKEATKVVNVKEPVVEGNIGSVDFTPEVAASAPDLARTNIPAPVEERSFNAPSKVVDSDRSTWIDPMVQARRSMGFKKGGSVKSSSKVSSASRRGDGCCVRGKTKGRMV